MQEVLELHFLIGHPQLQLVQIMRMVAAVAADLIVVLVELLETAAEAQEVLEDHKDQMELHFQVAVLVVQVEIHQHIEEMLVVQV